MADLNQLACPNQLCRDHGSRGRGNLRWGSWSGRDGQKKIRMVHCRTCKTDFSERSGTLLERSKLPDEKALAVMRCLAEGLSIRQTARRVGVSKGSVERRKELANRMIHELLATVRMQVNMRELNKSP